MSSCAKTNTVTKTVTDTIIKTVTDTVTLIQPDNSVASRLMGKQWIVDSLYHNYTSANPSDLGTRIYARGASNNQQDLDAYIEMFWSDGQQYFVNPTINLYAVYTFSFLSSDSLNLVINNPQPDYARLVTLTSTHMTTYDSTNSAISFYSLKAQ